MFEDEKCFIFIKHYWGFRKNPLKLKHRTVGIKLCDISSKTVNESASACGRPGKAIIVYVVYNFSRLVQALNLECWMPNDNRVEKWPARERDPQNDQLGKGTPLG